MDLTAERLSKRFVLVTGMGESMEREQRRSGPEAADREHPCQDSSIGTSAVRILYTIAPMTARATMVMSDFMGWRITLEGPLIRRSWRSVDRRLR